MATKPRVVVDNTGAVNVGLAAGGEPPHDGGMLARVAVLEEIARNTEKVLDRMDQRMVRIEERQASDFKWLFGLGIGATGFLLAADAGLFGFIAHGFHWL